MCTTSETCRANSVIKTALNNLHQAGPNKTHNKMSSIKIKKERLWELVSYKSHEWDKSGHTNVPSTPPPSCNAIHVAVTHLLDEVRSSVQVD